MQAQEPMEAKKLGRKVTPFDDAIWKEVSRDVVTRGCMLKFSQNSEILAELLGTKNCLLVECAPRDLRWGIGYGVKNPKANSPGQWRGTNWLGQCLTLTKFRLRELSRGSASTSPSDPMTFSEVRGHLPALPEPR